MSGLRREMNGVVYYSNPLLQAYYVAGLELRDGDNNNDNDDKDDAHIIDHIFIPMPITSCTLTKTVCHNFYFCGNGMDLHHGRTFANSCGN